MVTQQIKKSFYTFDEYLAFEAASAEKHEYCDGEILEMSGGSLNHGIISNNIGTALNNALDKNGKNCTVTNSKVKIFLETYNHSVYPDSMVFCGTADLYKDNNTVITNPLLIIEVLSKSTKHYDKGEKFEKYRSLLSFKEYVIVWQTIPKVLSWYKEEESLWRISSAYGMDAKIPLYSIDASINLKDIYKKVKGLQEKETKDSF